MSEFFVYHPSGTESLEAFNARLAQFCSDNPVVDIDPSLVLDDGLSLSLVEAKDMSFMLTQALQPVVLSFDKMRAVTLEQMVSDYQKRLTERSAETTILRYKQLSSSKIGYVLLILHAYDIEVEQEPENGEPR